MNSTDDDLNTKSNTFKKQNAHLSLRLDSHHLPILHHYLLDGLVQHVRPAIDGTQPGMETQFELELFFFPSKDKTIVGSCKAQHLFSLNSISIQKL